MANITKMFVHYDHTIAEFKAAGLETTYANSIVFISGAGSETPSIYTHNKYYGNVQEALDAIAKLAYIKGVKVGDKTYTAPSNGEGAYVPFASADPATVTLDANAGTITFGLTDAFKKKVNDTATTLGAAGDASTDGTIFGEIARLDDLISALVGSEGGSINDMIKEQINALDASIDSSVVNGFKVSVYEHDGKITKVDVTAPDVSTFVDDKIDASIKALDSSAEDLSNGFKVYVELEDGKLKENGGVIVTAPDVDGKIVAAIDALDSSAADTDNGIYVKVTEENGKITGVDVSASVLIDNYKKDISDAIDALDSSAEDIDNGIRVKVTEEDGKISGIIVDASGMTKKADLDELGKILADQLPDYILGQVLFGGTIDGSGKVTASNNFKAKYGDTTVVPTAAQVEGAYFVATGNGTTNGVAYNTGDWVISTGESWVKVDNTDAVSSVAGLTGAITASALAAKLSEDGIANELALKSELNEVNGKIADLDATLDASSNGVRVAFKQEDGKVKDLVVEAPNVDGKISTAIGNLDSSAADTDNGIYVKVTEENGKITAVDVSATNVAQKSDITTAISNLDASVTSEVVNGVQVRIEEADGKVSKVTVVSAPDVDGKIDDAIAGLDSSKEDSDNGVKVAVTQTDGKIASVDVTTTIANTSDASSEGLVDNAGLHSMFAWVEL